MRKILEIKNKETFSEIEIPKLLLHDENHVENIELPLGFDEVPISSSPQYTLYRLLRYLQPKTVLEIGTQEGSSALIMALAFRDNDIPIDITCVDPFFPSGDNDGFSTLANWFNNIYSSGFKSGIQLLLSSSEIILPQISRMYDFIFVDGSHAYEHVRQDCLLSLKLLKDGGYFMVHDTTIYKGVRMGVNDVIREFNLPYSVNNLQKNHRGDLCGWTIVRKKGGIKSTTVHAALEIGKQIILEKKSVEWPGRVVKVTKKNSKGWLRRFLKKVGISCNSI